MQIRHPWQLSLLAFFLLCAPLAVGCSDDTAPNQSPSPTCNRGELWDPWDEVCIPADPDAVRDTGANSNTPDAGAQGTADANQTPAEQDGAIEPDATTSEPDSGPPPVDPACDQDRDGVLSYACGGLDCDDNDANRSPNRLESCDGIDNDCNGFADDGMDCTFYGHTATALYKINPFSFTADKEADLIDETGQAVRLLDIDTHPRGVLYGISREALYAFHDFENYWIQVASLAAVADANGLAIDLDGTAYITAQNNLFRMDLAQVEQTLLTHGFDPTRFRSLRLTPTRVSINPSQYISSGDCVVNKQNTLYMTSKHDPGQDHLVEIDRMSGQAQLVGPMGFTNVFGLTAGWNRLFGTTRNGDLIAIDRQSGQSRRLHTFGDKVWYGTASTPQR